MRKSLSCLVILASTCGKSWIHTPGYGQSGAMTVNRELSVYKSDAMACSSVPLKALTVEVLARVAARAATSSPKFRFGDSVSATPCRQCNLESRSLNHHLH